MENFNFEDIEIKFEGLGAYGIHHGFFNGIAVIEDKEYAFQCCCEGKITDFSDCGFDWGVCRDANHNLAKAIGWENVLFLIEEAYKQYVD